MVRISQEVVLGALLGMAIGDALGMPFEGVPPGDDRIRTAAPGVYLGRSFPDGAELKAGEFTDESEIALCIIETYTSTSGELDLDIIRARMEMLARGESRRWMNSETLAALGKEGKQRLAKHPAGDMAARGIPLGLIYAANDSDDNQANMAKDAVLLAGLTHDDDQSGEVVVAVAEAVKLASRRTIQLTDLPHELETRLSNRTIRSVVREQHGQDSDRATGYPAIEIVGSAIAAASSAQNFLDGVWDAILAGGPTDARGAVSGAILGAYFGTEGIPQYLIDGLEGRMYVLLAGPWFYRTIQLRASPFRMASHQEQRNGSGV